MKKTGIFAWIFTATLFSVSPLTSSPAKAEGGCPEGLFPAGGGYCRNIQCINPPTNRPSDESAVSTLKKYNRSCPTVFTNWGNLYVPMR